MVNQNGFDEGFLFYHYSKSLTSRIIQPSCILGILIYIYTDFLLVHFYFLATTGCCWFTMFHFVLLCELRELMTLFVFGFLLIY